MHANAHVVVERVARSDSHYPHRARNMCNRILSPAALDYRVGASGLSQLRVSPAGSNRFARLCLASGPPT